MLIEVIGIQYDLTDFKSSFVQDSLVIKSDLLFMVKNGTPKI